MDSKTLKLKNVPKGRPLAIIMAWLLAKPKQLKNYIDIYINLGFDVITIATSPWQLLWPTKGTQMIARDAVQFLENNPNYSQLCIHGFSVGAYQFSELMVIMSQDMERYKPVLDRFQCQVWDSAADITEIPIGIPYEDIPQSGNNSLYARKSNVPFDSCKSSALILVSENDLIGPTKSNLEVKNNWEPAGIKVTFKSWEKSGHVTHMIHHKEEYIGLLYKHLEENMLEQLALKARAKL
uniref:Peptidase S9 prolyl oligopeptidase catalytic domain-containing protein n=1 Tax=Megaselia scalaris TaxID=36166 RepID=T1GQY4_MEGSC